MSHLTNTPDNLTERELKQLLRLLRKFEKVENRTQDKEREYYNDEQGQQVIRVVLQWIVWYGRDELSMDL